MPIIDSYDSILLDLDGVVYLGTTPIDSAVKTIKELQKRKVNIAVQRRHQTAHHRQGCTDHAIAPYLLPRQSRPEKSTYRHRDQKTRKSAIVAK